MTATTRRNPRPSGQGGSQQPPFFTLLNHVAPPNLRASRFVEADGGRLRRELQGTRAPTGAGSPDAAPATGSAAG